MIGNRKIWAVLTLYNILRYVSIIAQDIAFVKVFQGRASRSCRRRWDVVSYIDYQAKGDRLGAADSFH
jgi:hypothetical protein